MESAPCGLIFDKYLVLHQFFIKHNTKALFFYKTHDIYSLWKKDCIFEIIFRLMSLSIHSLYIYIYIYIYIYRYIYYIIVIYKLVRNFSKILIINVSENCKDIFYFLFQYILPQSFLCEIFPISFRRVSLCLRVT